MEEVQDFSIGKTKYFLGKTINFINKSNNENPRYADDGSSGFDLRAYITEDNGGTFNFLTNAYEVSLKPLQRMMIHTGIYFDVPEYTEIQVRPRSGLSIKQGLTVINTPGTIDESYTGECCILVVNLSDKEIIITNGDRIAQAVLMPVYNGKLVTLRQVEEINKKTDRGSGGFGHSGIK